MRKDFKEFITKGNLVQFAVAFIMGTAFATVVKSFIGDVIMPIIGKLIGNVDFANLYVNLSGQAYESAAAAREAGAAAIYYGAFINTVVTFLIVALVMFYLIRAVARLQRPAPDAPVTVKTCPFCDTSIPLAATRCPNCTSNLQSE